jgi:hypothetical protein
VFLDHSTLLLLVLAALKFLLLLSPTIAGIASWPMSLFSWCKVVLSRGQFVSSALFAVRDPTADPGYCRLAQILDRRRAFARGD